MSMPAYTIDTADDAAAVQLRCFRELAPAERIRKACAMSRRNRLLAMEAIRRRHPGLADDDVQLAYIELAYGGEIAAKVRPLAAGARSVSDGDDLIAALTPVAEALRRLGVRHYVGGSVASTFHGAIRSTIDVDLVCDLGPADVAAFVESFGEEFYVSPAAVRDAVQRKACFNLIHMPTSYKGRRVRESWPAVRPARDGACHATAPRHRRRDDDSDRDGRGLHRGQARVGPAGQRDLRTAVGRRVEAGRSPT